MFNITLYNDNSGSFILNEKNGLFLETLSNGNSLFENGRYTMATFDKDLKQLSEAGGMFKWCVKLEDFNSDLLSLWNGEDMFFGCRELKNFNSRLPNLRWGAWMFHYCKKLKKINCDLSSLESGYAMFGDNSALEEFTNDLHNLEDGEHMFSGCENLTSFISDLSSLKFGLNMFSKCKLNPMSILCIIDNLPETIPYHSKTLYIHGYNRFYSCITIGIDVCSSEKDGKDTDTQLQEFAEEAGYESWEELNSELEKKGWTVIWQYNGTTSSTYNLRNKPISLPIYAVLVEENEEKKAEYYKENEEKFYNIVWGHSMKNFANIKQFDSLEDAISHYGLKQSSRLI